MIAAMFSSRRRLVVVMSLTSLVVFVVSFTLALGARVRREPDTAAAARRVPVLGALACALAGPAPQAAAPVALPSPGKSFLELKPLSAEALNTLMQDVKQQRDLYTKAQRDVERDRTRLEMARKELGDERAEIEQLRKSVADGWLELKQARDAFGRKVTELGAIEAKDLKQLAQTYEGMDAARAAAILAKLDPEIAVKILYLMRQENAAQVLQSLDDEAAAQITGRLMLVRKSDN